MKEIQDLINDYVDKVAEKGNLTKTDLARAVRFGYCLYENEHKNKLNN